jgi:hypothetical protein
MKNTHRILLIMMSAFLLPLITIAQSDIEKYSPASFGFPDMIAGYPTLAVINLDQMPCTESGTKLLVLQSPIAEMQEYIKRSEAGEIHTSVQRIRSLDKEKWQILIVGPAVNQEALIVSYNEVFVSVKDGGCSRADLPDGKELRALPIPTFPGLLVTRYLRM